MGHRVFFALYFALCFAFSMALEARAQAAVIIGNPNAPVGGTEHLAIENEPATLNPLRGNDGYSHIVEAGCFDSLLDRNIETFEFEPAVAEKWEVAKDGKSITFTLRKGVQFHDGSPVTAEDVKFSFDVYFNPDLSDAVMRAFYENIEKAEILAADKIKFLIKKPYFKNLDVLAGLTILPKAYYGDKTKKMSKTMMGSGAYMLDRYDQGKSITLKRNPKWWGFDLPNYKGYNKVEKIVYEFIKDENPRLESFKKGDLDYIDLTPEQFEKKTDGPMWGQTVFKKQAENSSPKRMSYVGFNLKNKIFRDRNVRLAMVKLFDRKMMIEKFLYGKAQLASGPFYPQNPNADPTVQPVAFDVAGARDLLKKAGWVDSTKSGVLSKTIDGQKVDFHFTITLPAGGPAEKYLTIYQEELKKSGIKMDLKLVDWNTFQKIVDDRNFEALAMAWGGVVESDPHQIWHSESDVKGGSNFIGYSNPEVDKLIGKIRQEMYSKKRQALQRKVYRLVAEDYPAIFMWSPRFEFYAHSRRMKMVQTTYKYGVGVGAWWIEEAK
jgi:peptide/nickel transport system substrate-binding protein/microcin C transport system substrate-binding protein